MLLRPFAKIQEFAERIPALFFLVLYVALIPSFAVYYNSVAEEFFHSTAKYETDILGDGSQLRNDLASLVKDQFIEANGSHVKLVDEWIVDIREFRIGKASFVDGNLHFEAYMRFFSEDGRMTAGPKSFRFDAEPSTVVGERGSADRIVIKIPIGDQEASWPVKSNDIFAGKIRNLETPRRGVLALPMAIQDRISALKNSFDGFPARSTGTFDRLFYFSAVTQTTLGFGDIVPISERTRLAVGLQSVLGIVIIGLFLNSLAQPLSSRPESS